MATKLKKMKLTSVDLVRAGANQEADICLFKSADPPEPTESPTEPEKNIFKRFIAWLKENPTEAAYEPQNRIEKGEETPDLEFLYKSALTESLQSIMQDDTLTDIEKKDMTEESLRQYAEKIRELERDEEDYDGGDDIDEEAIEAVDDFDKNDDPDFDDDYDDEDDDTIEEEIIEEVEERRHKNPRHRRKDIDIDEIEEIELTKFNPYHGVGGLFTSSSGGSSSGGVSPKQQKALDHVMNGESAHGYSTQGKAESAAKNVANHQRTDVSIFDFGSTKRKAAGRYYASHGKEAKAIELSGKAKKIGTVYPDATNVHSAD